MKKHEEHRSEVTSQSPTASQGWNDSRGVVRVLPPGQGVSVVVKATQEGACPVSLAHSSLPVAEVGTSVGR